ncbi:unnamed protein product [Rotaria socialis]|uniref:UNC93-like protein MFSD11 n=2 Tax=Rotaria socialis TaxID=392032 RepID=A0A820KB27_9BILA|nr:unnamed protein product [Rotaria socialis]CAF4188276.1 unnamed protein product [Rotaria socialis]CAF4334343.1 unnamed protein product [Rotaria socialis]
MNSNRSLINILLLGAAFMVLFTAFQATGLVEQSVLEGVKNETLNGTDFQGSGYISLAIVYACATIANILAPAFVFIFGAPVSMFIGASAYFLYVLSFLSPMIWSFYLTSVLLGVGAAILWTAEGAYLAANSDEHTTSRNTGVFWALFQCSLLGGNLYVYLSLKADAITRTTRYPLFFVFSVVCAVGLVIYACIIWRWLIERRGQKLQSDPIEQKTALSDVIETFKIALRLLKTRNMLLLLIPFAYTEKLLGGGLFGFITKPKTSSQCALVILIGFFLQIIFYYSAWINFPADAPANETNAESYFQFSSSTSQVIAFVGSFIVGLGDSALNTQLFTVLASQFKHSSASAFALFQLVQVPIVYLPYFYMRCILGHSIGDCLLLRWFIGSTVSTVSRGGFPHSKCTCLLLCLVWQSHLPAIESWIRAGK